MDAVANPAAWSLLTTFISTIGFPIAVAIYTLIRLDRSMRELTAAVRELHQLVERLDQRHP